MNIEQTVVEKLKTLPPEKQREVLDFVEFLQNKTGASEFKSQDEEPLAVFVRYVLTHAEYDKENWKNDDWFEKS